MAAKMKNSKKYYSVARGRNTGIFTTWAACKKQVNGYPDAVFKSFTNRLDAWAFLETGVLEAEMRKCRQRIKSLQAAIDALEGTSEPSTADLYCP